METESVAKILPRVLLPYVQQWAERSSMPLLSRFLQDEQLGALLEKYGEALVMSAAAPTPQYRTKRSNRAPKQPISRVPAASQEKAGENIWAALEDRISALEADHETLETEYEALEAEHMALKSEHEGLKAEHQLQQAIFDEVSIKIRPLAQALGCCPKCFIGVFGCPTCGGRSSVGGYAPDYALLQEQVVKPLAALGVPLSMAPVKATVRSRQSKQPTATLKERKS